MKRLFLMLTLMVSPVLADDDDQERARHALEAGEILPLTKILEAAETVRAGRVIELELESEAGRWVYELELVTKDGRLFEIKIDAATANVLEFEPEDND